MIPHDHSHSHAHGHGHSHDKRIQEFLTGIHSGDVKKTLKQLRKVLKKEVPSVTDRFMFRIIEAIGLAKISESAKAEATMREIAADLCKTPDVDEHAIGMFLHTGKTQGLVELCVTTLEAMYAARKADISLADKLFDEYVAANKFYKMNILAKDLEVKTKLDAYAALSVYSMYMFAKYGGNPKGSPQAKSFSTLATMGLKKYLADKKIPSDDMSAGVYELNRQLLLMSDAHSDVLKLANMQKSLAPAVKLQHESQALHDLKLYADCTSVLLSAVFDNLRKGPKADYIHETTQQAAMLLLSLCISATKDVAELAKLPLKEIWESKGGDKVSLDTPKLDPAAPIETLKGIMKVFAAIARMGKIGDTVMPLNEVRSAFLVLLLISHKLFMAETKNGLAAGTKEVILGLAKEYAKKFISTASVYGDLVPFCIDLDQAQREDFVKTVKEASDALNKPESGDYTKYVTSAILYYKFRVSMYPATGSPDLAGIVSEVSTLYQAALSKLDKKLEKGERHPADDLALILDYLLDLLSKKSTTPGVINPWIVLRIALLSRALKYSPDNFDIRLQLLRLMMGHGLHYLAGEVFTTLRLKGVLTETLAHIYEKYLIEHAYTDKLGEVMKKFEKFSVHNTEELQGLKSKAIKDLNFARAEEFFLYEQRHASSHHRIVMSTASTLLEYIQNSAAKGQSIILSSTPKVAEQLEILKAPGKFYKNQDVYTVQPRIKRVPEISEFTAEIKAGFGMSPESDWDALILDPVLAPYVAIGKTNYREGIENLFGVLELPQVNSLLQMLCVVAGHFYEQKYTTLANDAAKFDETFVQLQAEAKKAPSSKVFAEYAVELEDIVGVFNYANEMMKMVVLFKEISAVKDPGAIEKHLASCTAALKLAHEHVARISSTLKDLVAKKPVDPAQKMTAAILAQHPLLSKSAMRRTMLLLQYFSTSTCILFTVLKSAFPNEIAKRPKKGEATPGEAFKKSLVQFKKEITAVLNEIAGNCQGFKLSEDVVLSAWEQAIPEAILKVPIVSAAAKSDEAQEIAKQARTEMINSILHVEVVFRPIIKSISGIDI